METIAPSSTPAFEQPVLDADNTAKIASRTAPRERGLGRWIRQLFPGGQEDRPPVIPPPNARELATEVRDLQTLHEATLRVARSRERNEGLHEILSAATAAAGTHIGMLMLAASDGKGLRLALGQGFRKEVEDAVAFVPSGVGANGAAFQRQCRVIIEDARTDPLCAGLENLVRLGRFVSCHAAPLLSRNGEVLGVISVHYSRKHVPTERELRLMDLYAQMAVDFLERWQADEALRANERRMQQLFSAMPVAVYTCDATGRITFHNAAAADLWGREPRPEDRWCGSFRQSSASGVRLRSDESAVAKVMMGAEVAANELIIEREDGSRRHVLPNLQPLRDSRGEVTGVVNVLVDITARKDFESRLRLSEERCRESEAQLRFVTDLVPVMIFRCNAEERFVFANRAYLEHRRATLEEILGSRLIDVVGAETYSALRPFVQRVLAGETLLFEVEVSYPCIGRRHVAVSYVPDCDERGTVRGFVAAATDVTDSRIADATNRQLAAIVASSSDAIVGVNLKGVIESWNRGAETLFGYTAQEALGRDISSLIVPSHRQGEVGEICARIQAGENLEHYQTERRRKDGRIVHISLTISPICDAEGRTVGASKIARDVKDLHNAQEALRQRTRTLEGVNRISSHLVAELDLNRIVQGVTDAAREVSGAQYGVFFCDQSVVGGGSQPTLFTLSGAATVEFERFGLPRHSPLLSPTFRGEPIIRSGDLTADPRFASALAGVALEVRSYLAVPVISRSGEVLGALIFAHRTPHFFSEETERIVSAIAAQAAMAIDNAKLYHALERELREKRRTEAELLLAQTQLQAHAALLEQRVEERTQSLREAITQMEEFSYTVSHDLRAPLRAMNTYAEALMEDYGPQLDDTARNYLERIQRSSLRMEKLTHDVLTYSRIGRTEVKLATVNLDALLRDMVYQYAEFQPPSAEIKIRRPLHDVLGHEVSLGQCVANLLTNAVKFVAPGVRPKIQVHTEAKNGLVRLWICDNGIGIEAQYQPRLFHVFERLHGRQQYEGTGIGLAIVRKAIDKMGGSCGVESDGQNGSCFWIELPEAAQP